MGLFSNKKDENKGGCCCGGSCNAETMVAAEQAKTSGAPIKILGSGCPNCNKLEASVKAALTEMGRDTEIDHVTDFSQIASYGVMTTPALVVNGKVVSYGKVLKVEEAKKLLEKVL